MKLDKQSEAKKKIKKIFTFVLIFLVVVCGFLIFFHYFSPGSIHIPESWKDGPLGWVFRIAERKGWITAILVLLVTIFVLFIGILDMEKNRKDVTIDPFPTKRSDTNEKYK
ncbi:hypothetical protein NSQ59_27360 [Margalitia sp. FSL K6-0131]|uniref:hypothetical protein n=1 Tax=Margalitia sp. FSL K6-0131 TaxID=2954604 RepID=UPI0030F5D222